MPGDSEHSNGSLFQRRLDPYKERKRAIQNTGRKYGLGKFKSESLLHSSNKPTVYLVPCTLYLVPCTLHLVPCTSKYQKMEMSFPWPPEKSLMYQDTWHLLYCWIHKVASSSWSKVFFSLKGQEVPASRLHEAAQKFSLSSSNTDLQSSITKSLVFTIVRHPFEHLVSTYRDKSELAKKYA